MQGLAAVLGGTQSLHTNSFDEALGLPTEHAATLALRTQQIIAEESGVTATADPLGGSYYVEALTDGVEHEARRWMERVAERGGAVAATETGFIAGAIAEHAYRQEMGQERGERVVVGVNRYQEQEEIAVPILRPDPDAEKKQAARLREHRAQPQRDRLRFRARRPPHRRAGRRRNARPDARRPARGRDARRDLHDAPGRLGHLSRGAAGVKGAIPDAIEQGERDESRGMRHHCSIARCSLLRVGGRPMTLESIAERYHTPPEAVAMVRPIIERIERRDRDGADITIARMALRCADLVERGAMGAWVADGAFTLLDVWLSEEMARTDVGVDERTWELMTEGNLFHGQGVIFTPDLSYLREVAAAILFDHGLPPTYRGPG